MPIRQIVVLFLLLLAGCSNLKPIPLYAPFDVQAAKDMLKDGPNRIYGSALLRLTSGGVVSCAGLPVYLIPATGYATERMKHTYNSISRGYSSINVFASVQKPDLSFSPDRQEYHSYKKISVCDAQGNFEFDRVANGQFYVVTEITWQAGNNTYGGSLMELTSVFEGQDVRIVLSSR